MRDFFRQTLCPKQVSMMALRPSKFFPFMRRQRLLARSQFLHKPTITSIRWAVAEQANVTAFSSPVSPISILIGLVELHTRNPSSSKPAPLLARWIQFGFNVKNACLNLCPGVHIKQVPPFLRYNLSASNVIYKILHSSTKS